MAKVGDQAYTDHGIGKIAEEIKERGSKSYRVAGRNFSVWVPESRIRVVAGGDVGFSYGPMKEYAEEWQSPEHQELLYAAGLESTIIPGEPYTVNEKNHTTLPYNYTPQYHTDMYRKEQSILPGDQEIDADERLHPSDSLSGKSRTAPSGPQPNPDLFLPNADHPFADQRTGSYRPAGLNDRYAFISTEASSNSPSAQFRRDPVGFIRTCGHLWTDGDTSLEKFADYTNLLDAEAIKCGGIEHTAAWADVRQKALRLRHEGKVSVNEISPNAIYATVEGDHNTYDVMLAKSGSSQGIDDWACGCEWGRWAFKRQMTYVGRLCSHAYAAYQELQSQYLKDNPSHFHPKTAGIVDEYKKYLTDNDNAPESSSVATFLNTKGNNCSEEDVDKLYDYISDNPEEAPERDFKIPYTNDPDEAYKTADLLRTKPKSLSPDLHVVPKNEGEDRHEWTDVTKDDRETTGPDGIVHFSYHDAMRHLHAEGVEDFAGGGEGTGTSGGSGDFAGASASGSAAPAAPVDPSAGWGMGSAGSGADSGFAGASGSGSASTAPADPNAGWGMGATAALHEADILQQIRDLDPADEDLGHMDERNDKVRDLVNKAEDEGYGASQFVAATDDDIPSAGKGNYVGPSAPDWANEPFNGSGPAPKDWHSDSAGYIDENERTRHEEDWHEPDSSDIIKFNDSRSKPQQGPRKSSGLHDDEHAGPESYHVDPYSPDADPYPVHHEAEDLDDDGLTHFAGWGSDPTPSPTPTPAPVGQTEVPGIDEPLNDPGSSSGYSDPNDLMNAPQGHPDSSDMVMNGLGGNFSTGAIYADNFNPNSGFSANPGQMGQQPAEPGLGGGELSSPDTALSDNITASLHEGVAGDDAGGFFNPNNSGDADWEQASGEPFAQQVEQTKDELTPDVPGMDSGGAPAEGEAGAGGEAGAAGEAGAGAAAGGEAAELAPLLLAANKKEAGFDPVAAFDAGGFDASGLDAPGGGEAKRAQRAGGGPRSQVRVDPGFRGQQERVAQAPPPEDFGFDGGMEKEAYLDPDDGGDIVAAFHRSGGAGVMGNGPAPAGSTDDFASSPMVQNFLRTAGRVYSPEEQRRLEGEFHPEGARNMPGPDDLAGTHYVM